MPRSIFACPLLALWLLIGIATASAAQLLPPLEPGQVVVQLSEPRHRWTREALFPERLYENPFGGSGRLSRTPGMPSADAPMRLMYRWPYSGTRYITAFRYSTELWKGVPWVVESILENEIWTHESRSGLGSERTWVIERLAPNAGIEEFFVFFASETPLDEATITRLALTQDGLTARELQELNVSVTPAYTTQIRTPLAPAREILLSPDSPQASWPAPQDVWNSNSGDVDFIDLRLIPESRSISVGQPLIIQIGGENFLNDMKATWSDDTYYISILLYAPDGSAQILLDNRAYFVANNEVWKLPLNAGPMPGRWGVAMLATRSPLGRADMQVPYLLTVVEKRGMVSFRKYDVLPGLQSGERAPTATWPVLDHQVYENLKYLRSYDEERPTLQQTGGLNRRVDLEESLTLTIPQAPDPHLDQYLTAIRYSPKNQLELLIPSRPWLAGEFGYPASSSRGEEIILVLRTWNPLPADHIEHFFLDPEFVRCLGLKARSGGLGQLDECSGNFLREVMVVRNTVGLADVTHPTLAFAPTDLEILFQDILAGERTEHDAPIYVSVDSRYVHLSGLETGRVDILIGLPEAAYQSTVRIHRRSWQRGGMVDYSPNDVQAGTHYTNYVLSEPGVDWPGDANLIKAQVTCGGQSIEVHDLEILVKVNPLGAKEVQGKYPDSVVWSPGTTVSREDTNILTVELLGIAVRDKVSGAILGEAAL